MRVGAIVVAAGASRRMGGQDKLWLPLGDLPLLGHTLAALAAVAEIDELVVVSSPDGLRRLADLRAREPWCVVDTLVEGGAERPDSVYAGLRALRLHRRRHAAGASPPARRHLPRRSPQHQGQHARRPPAGDALFARTL